MILLHNIYGLLQGCYKGVRLAVQRPTIWDYGLKDQGLSVQSQISRLKRLRAPGVEASVGVRECRVMHIEILAYDLEVGFRIFALSHSTSSLRTSRTGPRIAIGFRACWKCEWL